MSKRFLIVGVTAVAAMWMYIDRVCFSTLADPIQKDLGLDDEEKGYLLGAFFFTYALFQIPMGALADRFGARLVLTVSIAAWSLVTATTGLVQTFGALLAVRLMLGITESGAYPAAAGLVKRWAKPEERGRFSSVVALGGRIGGASAPWLTATLAAVLIGVPVVERLYNSPPPAVPLGPSDGCDLRLTTSITDSSGLPGTGKDLVVVARIDDVLHFRIFDHHGKIAVDVDEKKLESAAQARPGEAQKKQQLTDLKKQLESLWPPNKLKDEDRNRVIADVTSLAGHVLPPPKRANWRGVFVIYGVCGLVVAALFWFVVRDRPPEAEHPPVEPGISETATSDNRTGLPPAQGGTPEQAPAPTHSPPTRGFFGQLAILARSRNMVFFGGVQFGVNLGWAFLITLLPTYLNNAFGVPLEERGRMQSVALVTGCCGMFFGGMLTDVLRRWLGPRYGRSVPLGITLSACATMFFVAPTLPSAWAVVVALGIMAFFVDLHNPAIWSFAQDVGGKNVGTALGWGNMWGNLGAALSPVLLTAIWKAAGWNVVFVFCGFAFICAAVCGLMLDATKPVDPEDAT